MIRVLEANGGEITYNPLSDSKAKLHRCVKRANQKGLVKMTRESSDFVVVELLPDYERFDIAKCPFCGCKRNYIREINGGPGIGIDGHFVVCGNLVCRAEGPHGGPKTEAVELWNNRVDNE